MTRTRSIPILLAAGVLAAGSRAAAQRPEPDDVTDVLLRINAPLVVPEGDTANTVAVIGDNATIAGTVREQLIVLDGTAVVSGEVRGSVAVVGGRLVLRPGARVGRDVILHRSTMERASGARIEGEVRRRMVPPLGPWIGIVVWMGMTIAAVVLGLVLAALAGRQLAGAARLIAERPGPTALAALIVVFGIPFLAVVSFFTVVGIPVGLALLLLVLPTLALAGYAVAGAWLGSVMLRRLDRIRPGDPLDERLLAAVALGIAVLQVVGLIPVLGPLIGLVASQLGAGALVYRSWLQLRREPAGETSEQRGRSAA